MDKYAILLATYNGEEYIRELLQSIEDQTRRDFTIYIHDDGSTDATLDIIREYIKDKDRYEILDFESKRGSKNNFLSMLTRVEAEYYMFADQDDVWLDGKVDKLITKIEQVTDNRTDVAMLVYSDMYVTDDKLNIISDSFIRYIGRDIHRNKLSQVLIDNPASGATMIINKALRDRAISYNDIDDIPMHDHWCMCIASACGEIYAIDEPLVKYRLHNDNVMGADYEDRLFKIRRNIRSLISLEFIKSKRDFHDTEIKLSRQLMYISGIDNKTKRFLIDLATIRDKSKIKRMRFYRRNGLDRKRHSVWMRLWV